MERSGDCSDDTVFAGAVFCGDFARGSTRPPRHAATRAGRVVPQAEAHFCRCPRHRSSVLLEPGRFSRLPSQGPEGKTAARPARVPHVCALPRRLMAKVELRGAPLPDGFKPAVMAVFLCP